MTPAAKWFMTNWVLLGTLLSVFRINGSFNDSYPSILREQNSKVSRSVSVTCSRAVALGCRIHPVSMPSSFLHHGPSPFLQGPLFLFFSHQHCLSETASVLRSDFLLLSVFASCALYFRLGVEMVTVLCGRTCSACHEEHHVQLLNFIGQSRGLEANIMGVFANSNSFLV